MPNSPNNLEKEQNCRSHTSDFKTYNKANQNSVVRAERQTDRTKNKIK